MLFTRFFTKKTHFLPGIWKTYNHLISVRFSFSDSTFKQNKNSLRYRNHLKKPRNYMIVSDENHKKKQHSKQEKDEHNTQHFTRDDIFKSLKLIPSFVAVAGFIFGIYKHFEDLADKREERRANLGRQLVQEIETIKVDLRELIIDLEIKNKSSSKNKAVSKDQFELLERKFGYILRYTSSYSTIIIPESLKIETEYQLQRFRKIRDDFDKDLAENPTHTIVTLHRCLNDIYEVINIASVISSANTIPENLRTNDEKLVYNAFHNKTPTKTIDE